jgi:hypothetical protein
MGARGGKGLAVMRTGAEAGEVVPALAHPANVPAPAARKRRRDMKLQHRPELPVTCVSLQARARGHHASGPLACRAEST